MKTGCRRTTNHHLEQRLAEVGCEVISRYLDERRFRGSVPHVAGASYAGA